MDTHRALYDIWENHDRTIRPWHAQMIGYVAHFETREQAEKFVGTIKDYRQKNHLDEGKKS